MRVSDQRRSEIEKSIVRSAKEGKNRSEIAAIAGISYSCACEKIRRMGLAVREMPHGARRTVSDEVLRELAERGKTRPEIAAITGLSTTAVDRRMKAMGLYRPKKYATRRQKTIQLAREGRLKHGIEEFAKLDLDTKPFRRTESSAIIYAAILRMRAEKYTLTAIGRTLGMSKQAIWGRLKRLERD
jgi:biotin operon repressor